MSALTIGSLFAGMGGFDLAAEAMGWDTAWFVEWDASCRFWLAEHFPGRPIYGDITEVDFTEVAPVDILCGGFPCQPASAAGKRLGTADDRWLWPEFARAIRQIRPRYVVAENVPGLVSVNGGRAFAEVLRDLAALGYDAEWDRLSAGDVGAPQERERVFIVAYSNSGRLSERSELDGGAPQDSADWHSCGRHTHGVGDTASARRSAERSVESGEIRDGARRSESERRSGEVGDTERTRRQGLGIIDGMDVLGPGAQSRRPTTATSARVLRRWDDAAAYRGADGTVRLIPCEAAERGPESPLWPVAPRVPGIVARLRAIGNTVVPQCVVEGPFQVIQELERQRCAA